MVKASWSRCSHWPRSLQHSPGCPSPTPSPPGWPSEPRSLLENLEPRTDAGPRVSQACVTAPRRQGGLSESEGTVRAALRPASFCSAEPARLGRREGDTRPRPSQPHALPPPQDPGLSAAPQSPERVAGGNRVGTWQSGNGVVCAGAQHWAPQPQPQLGPVAANSSCRGRSRRPATRQGPQPLGRSAEAESAQRTTRDR